MKDIKYHKNIYKRLENILVLKFEKAKQLKSEAYDLQIELINYKNIIRKAEIENSDIDFESKYLSELGETT